MRTYEEYIKRNTLHVSEPFEIIGIPDNIGIADWSFVLDEHDYVRFKTYLEQIAYRFECDYVLVCRYAHKPIRMRHFSRHLAKVQQDGYIKTSHNTNLSFGKGIYCYRTNDIEAKAKQLLNINGNHVDFDYTGIYLECVYDNDPNQELSKDDLIMPEIFIPQLILTPVNPNYKFEEEIVME